MRTTMIKLAAGALVFILANFFSGCSPVFVAQERPHHVIYTTPAPPLQQVVEVPVVPVWAPPYTYITQVHYYYFPDYMMYYDLYGQNYCYFNGGSWLHVTVLPSMPMYYGFNPYTAYVVVLNHTVSQPWFNHSYYQEQYPGEYYKTAYTPRSALGSNTVLRAYDENQSKPLFVDKRSNREVAVNYTERKSRTTDLNNRQTERSTKVQSPVTNRVERNSVTNENFSPSTRNSDQHTSIRRTPGTEKVNNNTPATNRSEVRNTTFSPRTESKKPESTVFNSRTERDKNEVRNISQPIEKAGRRNESNPVSVNKNQKETQRDSRSK